VAAKLQPASSEDHSMRYMVAWLLGVPFSVIVVWYILGHTACR